MIVKPAAGRLVRDPITFKPLPEEGAEKPNATYWRRCIARGDVVEIEAKKSNKEGK